eukprot:scaffold536_cov250-Pinguiococcus_pyrenoidosus.AAC.28
MLVARSPSRSLPGFMKERSALATSRGGGCESCFGQDSGNETPTLPEERHSVFVSLARHDSVHRHALCLLWRGRASTAEKLLADVCHVRVLLQLAQLSRSRHGNRAAFALLQVGQRDLDGAQHQQHILVLLIEREEE